MASAWLRAALGFRAAFGHALDCLRDLPWHEVMDYVPGPLDDL
jgi:hypothetical protein